MTFLRRAFLSFIYNHRLAGKRVLIFLNKMLPRAMSRHLTSLTEKVVFAVTPEYQGDTLPPIFHYWSRLYLSPKLKAIGLRSPEDLYFQEAMKIARVSSQNQAVSLISFGSGAAKLELKLVVRLQNEGIAVRMKCVDFNASLKSLAEKSAKQMGVEDSFRFTVADCNSYDSSELYDIVIVNQFFHHVEDLESFCKTIKKHLKPNGVLLTSDVVGRNGHVLWPSVDKYVQLAWRDLDQGKRHDHYFDYSKNSYESVDHSAYSNEGIRAQDVVGVLLKNFDFELFLTYAACVVPFIERRIGFNFDVDLAIDRDFIDRIAKVDEAALASAEYPGSHMLGVLKHCGQVKDWKYIPISPQMHVELTQKEIQLG